MGKGSRRRLCQVSPEEEGLRYGLAFGTITFKEWFTGMQKLKATKDSKGVCGNRKDGLMTDCSIDYGIVCRITNKERHRRDTCRRFREDK